MNSVFLTSASLSARSLIPLIMSYNTSLGGATALLIVLSIVDGSTGSDCC